MHAHGCFCAGTFNQQKTSQQLTEQNRPLLALLKQHSSAALYNLIYVEKTPVRLW